MRPLSKVLPRAMLALILGCAVGAACASSEPDAKSPTGVILSGTEAPNSNTNTAAPSRGVEEPNTESASPTLAASVPVPPDAAPQVDQPRPTGCQADSDCVPHECCHAKSCSSKEDAPDCKDAMCTKECRAGTLDCGGSCYCDHGTCAAKLRGL